MTNDAQSLKLIGANASPVSPVDVSRLYRIAARIPVACWRLATATVCSLVTQNYDRAGVRFSAPRISGCVARLIERAACNAYIH